MNEQIEKSVDHIQQFPKAAPITKNSKYRLKLVVEDYSIIYRETSTTIRLVAVWGNPQNPSKLHKLISVT